MNPDPFTWTLGIAVELIAVGLLGLVLRVLFGMLKRPARKPSRQRPRVVQERRVASELYPNVIPLRSVTKESGPSRGRAA